jgi:Chalcone isomerase-like
MKPEWILGANLLSMSAMRTPVFLEIRVVCTTLLLLYGICLKPAHALQIEGVDIPPHVKVDGTTLQLNGAGLRRISPLGIHINIYVASFYAPVPIRSEKAALAAEGPLQFNFTFLQGVNQAIISRAWRDQFSHSVTETYPGYDHDKDAFLNMVGNLDKPDRRHSWKKFPESLP